MHLPAEVPKLSKLPFILGDVALFAIAAFIAWEAPNPFAGGALIAMTTCGVVGALLLAVPFVVDYGRKTDALLTERQDQIAALAQTTSASAEQVSIAAVSLHSITEASARSAKALEALPLKLQEKIAEFKAQLNEVSVTENEALEQELQTLRTAETERLQSAVDELAQAAKDLSRLEALVRSQAAAAQESAASLKGLSEQAVHALSTQVKSAAGAARTELETALAQHRALLQADVAAAQNQAIATWNGRVSQALSEIDQRLEAFSRRLSALADTVVQRLESAPVSLAPERSATAPVAPAPVIAPPPTPSPPPAPQPVATEAVSLPPEPATRVPIGAMARPPASALPDPRVEPAADEDPFADPAAPAKSRAKVAAPPSFAELDLDLPPPPPKPSPARTRPSPGLPAAPSEPVPTPDGATRLLVTAYIGIGNKLFARGHGPGLSWDKGVPLQFVSIGKWRWDTADAKEPLAIKLYKNDQTECTAVGTLELEPGHLHEVTATF